MSAATCGGDDPSGVAAPHCELNRPESAVPSSSAVTYKRRIINSDTSRPATRQSDDLKRDLHVDDPSTAPCGMPTCRAEALARPVTYMDKTVSFHEMPRWCQEDIYILTGYRKLQFTYRGCIRSLFYLHNETGNVYTHLLGCLGFIIMLPLSFVVATLMPILSTTTALDVSVIAISLTGTITCLGLSTVFHLCCCHSREVSRYLNKADYLGIVIQIVFSNVPMLYYGFFCDKTLQLIYLVLMATIGTVTAVVNMSPKYSIPKYRVLRTSLFLGLGLAAIFPVSHIVVLHGLRFAQYAMSFNWVILMGVLYVVGALIFAFRIPERWYPGYFDIWFQSHQIFHVLVVTASAVHYAGLVYAYSFWHYGGNHDCSVPINDFARTLPAVGSPGSSRPF